MANVSAIPTTSCDVENNFLPSGPVSGPKDKRVSMPVNLSERSREIILGTQEEFGINKTELLTRVLEWFAGQDRSVRRALLEKTGDPVAELLRIRMGEIDAVRKGDATALPFEKAAHLARVAIDRMQDLQAKTQSAIQADREHRKPK